MNPHLLSPLSYSGNKYWLMPIIRKWIDYYPENDKLFFEPYFGSGNVSLNLIKEGRIRTAMGTDFNPNVTSFWEVVFGAQSKELINKIDSFELTEANIQEQLLRNRTKLDKAFNLLLRTKVNYGANIKTNSLRSNFNTRFRRTQYSERIINAKKLERKGIIYFNSNMLGEQNDAIRWFKSFSEGKMFWFIDPPYVEAGKRLYEADEVNHYDIFHFVSKLKGKWLMTYDDHPLIYDLTREFNMHVETVRNIYTHRKNKNELLICNDFSWYYNTCTNDYELRKITQRTNFSR